MEDKKRIEENAKKWEGKHEASYTTQGLGSMSNLITGMKIVNKVIPEITKFMRALEIRRKAMGLSYLDLAEMLVSTEQHIKDIMLIEDQATTFELFTLASILKCKILLFDEHEVD